MSLRRRGALTAVLTAAGSLAAAAPPGAVVLEGACTSHGAAGCERCEIVLAREVELAGAGGALAGSCPAMAAGRYELGVSVPVKLTPRPESGPPRATFFQVFTSFGAAGHDNRGRVSAVLPETPRASWSWWNPSGMTVDRTEVVDLPQRFAIDVSFRLSDAQYYIPARAEGDAHRDGTLFFDPGTVIRLTRVPSQVAAQRAGTRDLSDATVARVVPGRTTKAQVRALLGEPWRDTLHGDDEHPANDVWDYRGRSAAGGYVVHIEFDQKDVARLVAKIPDAGVGVATVAKDPPATR